MLGQAPSSQISVQAVVREEEGFKGEEGEKVSFLLAQLCIFLKQVVALQFVPDAAS